MYQWFLFSNLLLFISGVKLVTSKDVFHCSNGEEIPSEEYCDGVTQCSDNSDEDPDICDITSNEFNCDTPGEVISINKTCDGIKDCTDGSDESSSACIDHKCDVDKFQCAYGGCINSNVVCDGVMDCTDGTDEQAARCSSIQKKCKLPDVQPTISYNVFGCASCKPGEHVKAITKINFTCNEGYVFETSQPFFIAECKDSKWLPEIPICRELTLPNRRLLTYSKGFCPPIVRSYGTNVACSSKNDLDVNCKEPVHAGTEATFTCEKYYKLKGSITSSVCLNNGQWSHNNIRCESSCFSGSEVALVVHGTPIIKDNEVFPWVAGLYGLNENHWEYRCGATLISDNVLITAAHCVWNEKPKDLKIVMGKIYRDFYLNESKQESFYVKNIRMLSVYQDRNGNYGSDVAILILYSRIRLSDDTHPVCLEWNEATSNEITTPGASGLVAGWGFTEDDKPSNELRYINIPIIDDAECIKNEPVEFRKYVTYTSFCAGYKNGTSVCNGDSGSGLVFNSNGNWFIEGLVSVSPRRTNAFLCEPTLFSIFTKIGSYKSWIKAILNEVIDK